MGTKNTGRALNLFVVCYRNTYYYPFEKEIGQSTRPDHMQPIVYYQWVSLILTVINASAGSLTTCCFFAICQLHVFLFGG